MVAVLSAGCAFPISGSNTTTTAGKTAATTGKGTSTTSTSIVVGSLTPQPADKTACASFNALKADGKKVTKAELQETIKTVREATNRQLQGAAKRWGGSLAGKKKDAKDGAKKAEAKIKVVCTKMGLE